MIPIWTLLIICPVCVIATLAVEYTIVLWAVREDGKEIGTGACLRYD